MKINIVLFEPEIPQNTGNIMRTCVGINAKLHLIKPLGFSLDEKHLRRSALDYFEHLNYDVYENFDDFTSKNKGAYYFLTRYGKKTYSNIDFKSIDEDIYLIFGKESTGVDRKILSLHIDNCYRIPTTDKIRSLNLSNAVAITCFEVLRQLDFMDLEKMEPKSLKGSDYLDKFK
ncbi:tRNA (cytidine(34)-2'-O)-methyltransferase [Acholeplasma sp. OttesenSCG-928-E16]|nr:tRNA (cytidine(34)-2'-O)-methyltransferase [Acholeplasma sp. OttesenSCG-928-E16]